MLSEDRREKDNNEKHEREEISGPKTPPLSMDKLDIGGPQKKLLEIGVPGVSEAPFDTHVSLCATPQSLTLRTCIVE